MSSDTWPRPGGVTFVIVETWGSGATGASALPGAWRGQGGGGGGYSRKRVPVVSASYGVVWGDGTTYASEPPTTFDSGGAAQVKANAGIGSTGGPVEAGMDLSYSGGDGFPSDNAPGHGTGGGGGAGRAGAGSNGTDPAPGGGGSNAPSTETGNGGAGGIPANGPGSPGLISGGGGGGMGAAGPFVPPDLSGLGAEGGIIIYDDTDGHGFDPYRAHIGTFGSPPAAPPPVAVPRRSAFIM